MADVKKKGMGWFKKLLIAAVAFGVLLVVAVIVAPRFIDWDKVRVQIEEQGTATLGRKVEIKELKVGILSGVEIGGFKIGPAKGTDQKPLVSADRVVAKYALLPLLRLKIVINRIELVQPKIFAGKSANGKLTVADMIKEAPAGAPAAKAKPVSLPIDLGIDVILVSDGSLVWRDASVKPALTAGVSKLQLEVKDFSLSGEPAGIKTSCIVDVDGKTVPVSAEGKMGIAFNRSTLTLAGFTAKLPGITATTDGVVTEFQTLPTMKIKQKAAVDLGAVWTGYAAFIPKGVRDTMGMGGSVTADLDITGTAKKPVIKGSVACQKVSFTMKDFPGIFESLEGTVAFTDDTLKTTDLRFISLGNPFTVEADLHNLQMLDPRGFDMKRFAPKGKFSAASPKVVLDSLYKEPPADAKSGKGKPVKEPPPPPEPDFRGMIPKGAELDGDVAIGETRFRKITFSKQKMTVKIRGGDIAYTLTDGSYGSEQTGSGTIRLSRFPVEWEAKGTLKAFAIKPFLDDSVASFVKKPEDMQGRIAGTADADYDLDGKGITPPNLKKKMKGKLRANVADGQLKHLKFFENGLVKVLKLGFLSKDIDFKAAGGTFNLADGKATTPDFAVDPGPDGDLALKYSGSIGLEGENPLKGETLTRFHPRHESDVMKGDFGKTLFTKEADGWSEGLWDTTGTMKVPILLPSKKALARKLKQEARQELKEKLPDLKDDAKKTLKGLFKKKK